MNRHKQRGYLNAALKAAIFGSLKPVFDLPLRDAGSGAVDLSPLRGNGPGTFTRATTAYTTLADGSLYQVGSGVARSCYSAAGVYLGYLAEGARTNLCLRSQQLSNAAWSNVWTTVTDNATVAPDGTTTAASLLNAGGTHQFGVQVTAAIGSAAAHTFSVWVKAGGYNFAYLEFDSSHRVWFNLSTVAVGTASSGVTGTITSYNNGWKRITGTYTMTGALQVGVYMSNADNTASFAGDGTSILYAWGAQLETASFASSYIPTTAASATRNGDLLTYPTAGNVLGSIGSAYAETTFGGFNGSSSADVIDFISNSNTPLAWQFQSKVQIYDGTTSTTTTATGTANTLAKMASSWGGSTAAVCLNGGTPVSGAFDGDMNPAATMSIGTSLDTNTNPLFGTVKNLRIYSQALPASRLASMTA